MGLDWGGSQLPSQCLLSLRWSQDPGMGSNSAPEESPKGCTCHLCSGMWQRWDTPSVHWTTKPRPRSLLTTLGTWTFSSCAGRGTQLPTFKGLVCKVSPAQGYWYDQRREDVQLGVEMQDIFAEGTARPPLSQTVTCGSGSQIKKKLMKLTENTDDSPLPGCTVRFCCKICGNGAF